jgi:nicotinate dehydrogenase subunit A
MLVSQLVSPTAASPHGSAKTHGQHWNPTQASKLARGFGMNAISIKVNGQWHAVEVDPETPLLFVLGDELGLRGPKFGCGMAQCGACTVIVGGQVMRSCVMPVSAVGKDEVTTLEGLGTPEKPHPIQEAFISEGAAQCGFCLSGVIMTAKAFLDDKPQATDQQISEALGGVLCRCFAHIRMLRAIRKYADARKP